MLCLKWNPSPVLMSVSLQCLYMSVQVLFPGPSQAYLVLYSLECVDNTTRAVGHSGYTHHVSDVWQMCEVDIGGSGR